MKPVYLCIPQPHRDTEKAAGMFGTLVIQLPSDFEGGQLNVCHQGKQTTFDFSGIEGMVSFHYAAFYADCVSMSSAKSPRGTVSASSTTWCTLEQSLAQDQQTTEYS